MQSTRFSGSKATAVILAQILLFFRCLQHAVAVPDVHYELNVTSEWQNPDGYWRPVLVANGQLPGPTIRVKNHGRVIIKVLNLSDQPLSIHWHGIDQKDGGQWYDGVAEGTQCPIMPGELMVYNFTVNQEPGLNLYHGHYFANDSDGLIGVFIIDPNEDPEEQDESDLLALAMAQDFDEEIVVNVQDWFHMGGDRYMQAAMPAVNSEFQATNNGAPFHWPGFPDSILINGQGDFECPQINGIDDVEVSYCWPVTTWADEANFVASGGITTFEFEAGRRYLMRFVNTGIFYWLTIEIEDHEFIIIAADGLPVEPMRVSKLEINIGERLDVIVEATGVPGQNYTLVVQDQLPIPSNQTAYIVYADEAAGEPTVGSPWLWEPLNSMANYSGVDPFDPRWVHPLEPLPEDMQSLYPDTTIYLDNFEVYQTMDDQDYLTWTVNKNEYKHDPSGLPLLPLAKYGLVNGGIDQPGASKFLLKKGEVVDLVLVNHGETWVPQLGNIIAHPWHLHGMKFNILGYGPGRFNRTDPFHQSLLDLEKPRRSDMATLHPFGLWFDGPAAREFPLVVGGPNATGHCFLNDPRPDCKYENTPLGWAVLRVKAENPGVWDFHCHILLHYLMGLRAQILIAPDEVPDMPEGLPMTCGSQTMWDDIRAMAGLDATSTRLNGQTKMTSAR